MKMFKKESNNTILYLKNVLNDSKHSSNILYYTLTNTNNCKCL